MRHFRGAILIAGCLLMQMALNAATVLAQYTNIVSPDNPGTGQTGTIGPGQTATMYLPPLPSPPSPEACDETYEWWVNGSASNQPVIVTGTQGTEHSTAGSCPMIPWTGDSHGFGSGVAPFNQWQGGIQIPVIFGYGHELSARRDTIIPGSCSAAAQGPYQLQTGVDGQMPVLTQSIYNPSGETLSYTMLAKFTCNPVRFNFPSPTPTATSTPTPSPTATASPSPNPTSTATPTPVCDFTLIQPTQPIVASALVAEITGTGAGPAKNWMNYYLGGTYVTSSAVMPGTVPMNTSSFTVPVGTLTLTASEFAPPKSQICSQSVTVTTIAATPTPGPTATVVPSTHHHP